MNLYETYETVHTAKLESDQRTVVMVTQIQEFSKADYVERLTGMKTDKLMEVSQGSEAWRELVVSCVDPQPTD